MGRATPFLHRLTGLMLLAALPAHALIIASGDGTGNTTAPSNDPGWANVGRLGGRTAIYLGNGWVITASHVGVGDVTFRGVTYPPIPDSRVQFETRPGYSADLIVFRLEGEPPLPPLPIAYAPPAEHTEVLMIGNGPPRGAPMTWNGIDGWAWARGNELRWGTNRVEEPPAEIAIGDTLTRAFFTEFSGSPPERVTAHEAQVATGDSGGAVFAPNGEGWELAGVLFARPTFAGQPSKSALYGNLSFAVDLSYYREEILGVVGRPARSIGPSFFKDLGDQRAGRTGAGVASQPIVD